MMTRVRIRLTCRKWNARRKKAQQGLSRIQKGSAKSHSAWPRKTVGHAQTLLMCVCEWAYQRRQLQDTQDVCFLPQPRRELSRVMYLQYTGCMYRDTRHLYQDNLHSSRPDIPRNKMPTTLILFIKVYIHSISNPIADNFCYWEWKRARWQP